MKLFILILMLFPAAIVIGLFDYLVFSRFLKCPVCNKEIKPDWYFYIVPTFIEMVLFIAGIAVGVMYALEWNI